MGGDPISTFEFTFSLDRNPAPVSLMDIGFSVPPLADPAPALFVDGAPQDIDVTLLWFVNNPDAQALTIRFSAPGTSCTPSNDCGMFLAMGPLYTGLDSDPTLLTGSFPFTVGIIAPSEEGEVVFVSGTLVAEYAAPEPASLSLLLTGVGALALYRGRCRQRRAA